ncbi:hypothetical protein PIPA1_18820 [Pelosinus sp. IPA-1]|nr:hypothetical protein PIPA1_18820 [Pelosinus sp. IPA-1]
MRIKDRLIEIVSTPKVKSLGVLFRKDGKRVFKIEAGIFYCLAKSIARGGDVYDY